MTKENVNEATSPQTAQAQAQPGSGAASGYASIVEKLEGIRDQLANLRDEIPIDYKGRRVDGVIWDMLGRINTAESIAKDEA